MARNHEQHEKNVTPEPQHGALVPSYSPLEVIAGVRAYRRGDFILYTIKGEPAKVLELVGELDRRGVNEVIALVSHRVNSEGRDGDVEAEPDGLLDKKR